MFTIKMMRDDGYDASQCKAYRVEKTEDGVYIHTFSDESPAGLSMSLVSTVAYVENSEGKTVDKIYGLTSVAKPNPGLEFPERPKIARRSA